MWVSHKQNNLGGIYMVERKSSSLIEEFEGTVETVELKEGDYGPQYEIVINPTSIEVGGETGKLRAWVGMSKTSSQDAVAEGSAMDSYLRQVEICLPDAKKASTVDEALGLLVGKNFKFQNIEHGRAFDGNPARKMFTPVQLLA